MDRKKLFLVVSCVVVLAIAVAAGLYQKAGKDPADLGLDKARTTEGASGAATGSPDSGDNPKRISSSSSPKPAGNLPGGSDSSNDDGSGDPGGPDDGTPPPDDGKPSDQGKTAVVEILWWNDTKNKAPEGCEVLFGTSSFKPSPGKDSAVGSVSGVPVGTPSQLTIYPDGRGGKKLVVPFTFDSSMKPDSERDAIHVEISDTRVRVLGNPINGFDQSFDRF